MKRGKLEETKDGATGNKKFSPHYYFPERECEWVVARHIARGGLIN